MKWINPIVRSILIALISTSVTKVQAEPLPRQVDELFYQLGGGRALPRGAAGYVTYRIGARFTVSPGYSCGEFNLEDNLEQALNRIRDQVQGLPDQLGMAATNMISALPMYLVKNYAPDIYGILMWNLDQSIELFKFQYKTCETLEAEIMNNNAGYNPYATAARAAVLNQWEIGARSGSTIDQTSRSIQSNPGNQGFNFLGNGRGRPGSPIPLKHDLMVVAYNNRIGRFNDPLNTTAPNNTADPLVQTWPTPAAAADWLIAATGEVWLVVGENSPKESAPGVGLRPEIDLLTENYEIAIINAVELIDFAALDTLEQTVPTKFRISDKVIESIRSLRGDEKGVAIQRLASDIAVSIVKNKVDMATTLLRSAVQDPDVATSQIAGVAGSVALEARKWIREEIEEISMMMAIERQGMGTTPLVIIKRGAQRQLDGSNQLGTPESRDNTAGSDGFPGS